MALTRVFLERGLAAGETVGLPAGQAHHLRHVLRAKVGDEFEVVGKDGKVYRARLAEGDAAVVVEPVPSGGPVESLELYQAVPKGKRMDLVVEKATELGATRIVPLLTERSVARPGEGNKLERWRRISESAARQSLRALVPEVERPVPFREAVEGSGGGVVLHNDAGLKRLEEAVVGGSPARLFVGPEGGFSEGELRFASEKGLVLARMGGFRLRSETAGIAAVCLASAALETKGTAARDESKFSEQGVVFGRAGTSEK